MSTIDKLYNIAKLIGKNKSILGWSLLLEYNLKTKNIGIAEKVHIATWSRVLGSKGVTINRHALLNKLH